MFAFTIEDWYWGVGEDASQVWSSKRAQYVPASDADYISWLEGGQQASQIASMAELEAMFSERYPRGSLNTYNVHVREITNSGGIVVNGRPFATDVVTLGSLNSAFIYTQSNAAATFAWKLPDGSYVTLAKQDVETLQAAVSKFGQDCYACEADVQIDIDSGAITTHEQIEAAFAAVDTDLTGMAGGVAFKERRRGGK